MGDQVLVAPPGITRPDQFAERNTERYVPPPRQPNPIGRPTAVVGGPAYFTPEGYQAPIQPTQAFMPTDRMPDPIADQFRRQSQSPMGQQYQEQYQATQAPIRAAEAAKRAEEQAAQDARFQEQMDRIAELEGQLATPAGPAPVVEPVVPPGAYPPYIPGVTPFPGIPGLGDLDFSGLPGIGDIDMDRIIQEYQDRQNAGEPEPFDSFLPPAPPPAGPAPQEDSPNFLAFQQTPQYQDFINSGGMGTMDMYTASDGREFGSGTVGRMYDEYLASLGQQDSNTSAPTPALEPVFTPPPTMPEPNGFFPGIDPRDFEDMSFEDMDFSNIPNYQMPAPTMPAPQAQAPTAAPIYTPPPSRIETPQMGGRSKFDFSNLGNFNLR